MQAEADIDAHPASYEELATRHSVHRVYLWGGSLFVLSVPARLAISGTGAWRSFAEMLTR